MTQKILNRKFLRSDAKCPREFNHEKITDAKVSGKVLHKWKVFKMFRQLWMEVSRFSSEWKWQLRTGGSSLWSRESRCKERAANSSGASLKQILTLKKENVAWKLSSWGGNLPQMQAWPPAFCFWTHGKNYLANWATSYWHILIQLASQLPFCS